VGFNWSVNTNASALVALQNLNATSRALGETQSRIASGRAVDSARDNGAVWAIAQNQRSTQQALNAAVDSVNRGKSTADVALAAATEVGDILNQMKQKALAASETSLSSESRSLLNDEYIALRDSISRITSSAEFNGANLLKSQSIYALGEATGQTQVTITGMNLSFAYSYTPQNPSTIAQAVPPTGNIILAPGSDFYRLDFNKPASDITSISKVTDPFGKDAIKVSFGPTNSITSSTLYDQLTSAVVPKIYFNGVQEDPSVIFAGFLGTGPGGPGEGILKFSSDSTIETAAIAAGELPKISNTIVALNAALAKMGAETKRIEAHATLLAKQQDSLEAGIGNLVDADLAKESARFTALQTKQQLGTQALSIANKNAANLLSLFRQ
jgi:flagellin